MGRISDRRTYPSQPGLLQPGILPLATGPIISAMAQNSFIPLIENIMKTLWPSRSRQTASMRSLQLGRLVTAPLARQYLMSESRSTFMQMNLDCAILSGCCTNSEVETSYLERHLERLRVRVGEHLGCASESLLAHVARDVQELVNGVRMFGLPPDFHLVGHRIVELHVRGVGRADRAMAGVSARGGWLIGSVASRREAVVIVVRHVVTGHLIRRREETVVAVAEVFAHLVLANWWKQCGRADAPKGRRQKEFSLLCLDLLKEVNEELGASSKGELCDGFWQLVCDGCGDLDVEEGEVRDGCCE